MANNMNPPVDYEAAKMAKLEEINAKLKAELEKAYADYLNTLRNIEKMARKEAEEIGRKKEAILMGNLEAAMNEAEPDKKKA